MTAYVTARRLGWVLFRQGDGQFMRADQIML